jgi:predicted nucleic acid-binding protein
LSIAADSSFFVALYAVDSHSSEAHRRMAAKRLIYFTPFNRVELAHALYFQVFRGRIDSKDAARAWLDFETDCSRGVWDLRDLPPETWRRGVDLATRFGPKFGVRTLDSLHVACALELRAKKFWTFDERQAKLAEAVGLDTAA